MIYIGVDPSFTNTGVCYLDIDKKEIKFVAISPNGKNDHYVDILNRSANVALNIIRHSDLSKDVSVVIEEPLMVSQRASSLGMLSGIITWTMAFMPSIKEIYSLNPRHISGMNNHLKKRLGMTAKGVSRYLAAEILEYLVNEYNYSIDIYNDKTNKDGSMRKRVLSHDEAEAFLLLIALLIEKGFFNSKDMSKLASLNKKLKRKPNITLIKGEK